MLDVLEDIITIKTMKLVDRNDPTLWAVADPVTDIEQAYELAKELSVLMAEKNGMGLAAPQVGISKRFFVVRHENSYITFINPVIVDRSPHEVTDIEGCLSVPGLNVSVRRPRWIMIKCEDWPAPCKFTKSMARCVQHELDHLNGVCIFPKK